MNLPSASLARYSLRELAHRPVRTGLAVLGIAVATATLVDMLMLGGGIQISFAALLNSKGYEVRVTPRGAVPLETGASVNGFSRLAREWSTWEEIEGVAPVLAANLELETRRTRGWGFVLGVDPTEQGVYDLIEGEDLSPGTAVVSAAGAEELGAAIGDTLQLATAGALGVPGERRTFVIGGLARFVYAARGELSIAVPLEDVQTMTRRPDAVSFAMIRLAPDARPEDLTARLRSSAPSADIVTTSELVEQSRQRLSYFQQLAVILGSVSLVVTALLVGTIMAVSISERRGTIAALRAIGISRRSLLTGLASESLAICTVAGLLGLGLGWVVAGYLESILSDFPGLPQAVRFFVPRAGSLLRGIALLLIVGAGAALVPAWLAIRRPIALTLHTDEP